MRYAKFLIVPCFIFFSAMNAAGHCEIPCGIYDDDARLKLIAEHVTTIEKSMKQIIKLQDQKPLNYNQLVRWISNKEKHADEIQAIVSQYFMTQRIKPDSKMVLDKLTLLHKMLIYAMKCKQTTDIKNAEKIRDLMSDFRTLYFSK